MVASNPVSGEIVERQHHSSLQFLGLRQTVGETFAVLIKLIQVMPCQLLSEVRTDIAGNRARFVRLLNTDKRLQVGSGSFCSALSSLLLHLAFGDYLR